ncbi:MAG: carboxypeptidase M32 [Atopobiaceae bacterium]|jgi:carboxypeptidase Taq|nr:carboxypeptidase M32 [Atopobiaceae bacterium]MCI2174178.1 carboxypeptidase M32 [Atopobiaceae bacterium]MCI2206819.1 carboxypeptidase M32 [Atopobiaceae bacterium]
MTQTDRTDVATSDVAALDTLERHLFAHNYALVDIMFNGETIDPPKGAAGRGEAMATLDEEHHELLCSPETGALLDRLSQDDTLDGTHAAEVRVLGRDRDQEASVPADVAADFTRLTCEAADVWHRAKLASDWDSFEPYLDRIIVSMREIAGYKDDTREPYDVWLDEFEHGTSRAFYDAFFSQVKDCVVPLVAAVGEKGWQPGRACVEGRFDEEAQWALARDLMELEGVDMDAIVLSRTEHPFTDSVTSQHAFIASHVYPDDVTSNVFSMLHEGGHAMYEQGVDPSYDYTCLKGGTSMGMHEAQSRFFENYVGRSEAFAPTLLATIARRFPERMAGVTPHDLWLATNRAEPSLVRTEADELTYPLHVVIRYEIEQMLFAGEATAADVPGLWADRYRGYLGVEVPDARHGALQDSHWSNGQIGYFPTYALGSAYGAQFMDTMRREGMDFEGVLASGDLAPIREWLRSRIWCFGRAKDPDRIMLDATGAPLDASHLTSYLTKKFSAIYDL